MYVGNIYVPPQNYPLIGVGFTFTILGVVTVCLRVFTRGWLIKHFGTDDALIVFSGLSSIGFLVAAMEQVRYGLNQPADPDLAAPFQLATYASMTCYNICHLFVKLSIALQCLRVFTTPIARRVFLGLLIYLAIYGPFCVLMSVFTCWPVNKYWEDSVEGKCLDRVTLRLAFAGVNIFNDLALVCAPLPLLNRLQMASKMKYILMGVFAAGGVASAVAIVRFYSLWSFGQVPLTQRPCMNPLSLFRSEESLLIDHTAKGMEIALWSCLESNLTIICACVPSLNPLLIKLLPGFITSSGRSRSLGQGYTPNHRTPLSRANSSWRRSRRNPNPSDSGAETGPKGIQVEQSFELGHIVVPDDDSEKNLVTSTATAQYHSEISIQAGKSNASRGLN
ncbi:unnamed protein product [Clonostachys rhizophaga]|uniref:Rhodopsin domain-containing protein n=1 Tax=Clonostachys rhizophaga TaxID=160324 RepID=A0A9N9YW22_9HYPO|nr:unnamed protein product [Clonostachys rhizophaga]